MNYFLKNELIENENLTSEGLLVYVALVKMTNNLIPKVYTNIGLLEYAIKDNDDSSRAFKDKIKSGLLNLVECNIISVIGVIDKSNYLTVDISRFRINNDKKKDDEKKEPFVILKDSDISKIVSYAEKGYEVDKCLKYLIHILKTVNNTKNAGYTSIDVLSERSGINKNTAMRYNNMLETMEILYIHRVDKVIKSKDGFMKKVNNTYGRIEDKNDIIKCCNDYITEKNIQYNGSISGDEKRSIKQRYNNFVKKYNSGYEFTTDEINSMNNMINNYNYSYRNNDEIEKLKPIINDAIIENDVVMLLQ